MTLLVASLAATALGVLLDAGRLATGGMVLSGCMVGTLVGDAMRHGRPRRTDVMTGAALLAVLGVLLLGALAADGVLGLGWFSTAMPTLVTGVLCFAVLSIVLSALLVWRMLRRGR